jgi:hypothetical protein
MAITWVSTAPMFSNPATQNENGVTYVQNFKVTYDISSRIASGYDVQLLETSALTAPNIPRYGDQFRGNTAAFCNSITTRVIDSQSNNIPNQVIVTCTFSTQSDTKKNEENNPLEKAPDIVWSTHFEREAVQNARILRVIQDGREIDKVQEAGRGNKIQQINNFSISVTNSSGQPFNPFPEKDVPYMLCSIVENKAVFDVKQANDFIQTVNVRSFKLDGYTIQKGQALLMNREASTEYQGKLTYRKVTTSILIKETHEMQILDNGMYIYGSGANKFAGGNPDDLIPYDLDGVNSTTAQRLNGKGGKLGAGAKSVFLNFGIFAVRDFRELNLPSQRL